MRAVCWALRTTRLKLRCKIKKCKIKKEVLLIRGGAVKPLFSLYRRGLAALQHKLPSPAEKDTLYFGCALARIKAAASQPQPARSEEKGLHP